MKELSIEEKAKAYDEALQRTRRWYDSNTNEGYRAIFEEIFPELKKSKDEKIRKVIYGWIYTQPSQFFDSGFSKEEMLAWLEKQGNINPTEDELEALRMAAYEPTKNWSEKLQSLYEKLTHCEQKPVFEMKSAEESLGIDSNIYNKIVDECIYGEQKSDDVEEVDFFDDFRKTDSEVEPKFHEGEWVIDKQGIVHQISNVIENVTNHTYAYDVVGGGYFNDNTEGVKLWTIQDAKAGDVLVNQNGEMPFIFKECKNNHIYCYCGYTNRKDIFFDKFVDSEGEELHWLNLYREQVYPATKEQRDLLFQKMKEAGYEWDTDKKELKKIEQKPIDKIESKFKVGDIISDGFSEVKIISIEKNNYIVTNDEIKNDAHICNWVVYFKDQDNWKLIEQKPAWSEEDERTYESVLYAFEHNYPLNSEQQKFIKSLKYRVQPQQEWSKEDEGYYDAIIAKLEVTQEDALLTDNEMDFLKSLEKRVFPKSTWNEEDEKVIHCLEYTIRHFYVDEDTIEWCCDWLKSLRPQNRWKPSEEQMERLKGTINSLPHQEVLYSLYQDLKKLI